MATTTEICDTLIKQGGYPHEAATVAQVLESLSDGLWYGMVGEAAQATGGIQAKRAETAVMSALSAYFPKHFKAA